MLDRNADLLETVWDKPHSALQLPAANKMGVLFCKHPKIHRLRFTSERKVVRLMRKSRGYLEMLP